MKGLSQKIKSQGRGKIKLLEKLVVLLGLVLTKKCVPGNAGQGLEQTGMVEVALSMARAGMRWAWRSLQAQSSLGFSSIDQHCVQILLFIYILFV